MSRAHRRKLQLKSGNDGVLVVAVDHGASAWGHVQAGDVLMAIDGIAIASDLTVDSPYGARLDFGYLPRLKQVGETMELTVLRNGQSLEISIALTCTPALVPALNSSDRPRYRVFGGLIFMPLDMDYCTLFEDIPEDFLYYTFYQDGRTAERSEVVLLSRVLPHEATRGYHDWEDYIVASVQGKKPRDFSHFNEILDGVDEQWLEVVTEVGERVVLDVGEVRAAHDGILEAFGIGKDRWLGDVAPAPARSAR